MFLTSVLVSIVLWGGILQFAIGGEVNGVGGERVPDADIASGSGAGPYHTGANEPLRNQPRILTAEELGKIHEMLPQNHSKNTVSQYDGHVSNFKVSELE